MARFHVIIPAAGSGSRMAADAPKQYLNLHAKPVIQHVIEVFEAAIEISSIHILLSADDLHWSAVKLNSATKCQVHYCGGDTRAATVLNGLLAITQQVSEDDWILVHDAARPGLTHQLLSQFLTMLKNDAVGGLLALPLADTLKRADACQRVSATVPRAELWQAQTPQMFRYAMLKEALSQFDGSPTDEAEAIEALGFKPSLVNGELRNLKITYAQDLAVVSALMQLEP